LHDNNNITFEFELEVETHNKTDPPLITVCNQNFLLSNGICKIKFACTQFKGFSIVWKNKTGSDTVCDSNGNIVADKNFKLLRVWIDGILAESWFITDCIYYPEYFRKEHNWPTEIKSPYVISFPGSIDFTWQDDFWTWYKYKRLSYATIENLEFDPDRVWKFVGSYDMFPELVDEFENLLNE
jgi:hypothetical protein